jgi:N utilization substance protein A
VAGLNAKGACIGPMGQRVRNVMSELHGEKIDIVDFSEDPATFVASALSPARVNSARVVDPQARAVRVIVPDYQLSLAIGKEGQNARLAARLTGCRIDIRSDAQPDDPDAAPSPGVGRPPLRSAQAVGRSAEGRELPRTGGPQAGHRPPPRRAEHPGPAAR